MSEHEIEAMDHSHPPAIIAGFSGWLLDAFEFFLVTFCLTAMAHEFHKTDAQMALIITMTMALRPVGGFLFGLLADRYGRRIPLMINMGFFAIAGVLTGLAPNYTTLLVVRGLFGIVMGGTWGVGASLAMEAAPARHRGVLSGLLQEGYAAGNVLAAAFYFFCFNRLGWRMLFILSSVPAIPLVLYILFFVKESTVWKQSANSRLTWREHLVGYRHELAVDLELDRRVGRQVDIRCALVGHQMQHAFHVSAVHRASPCWRLLRRVVRFVAAVCGSQLCLSACRRRRQARSSSLMLVLARVSAVTRFTITAQ